MLILKEMWKNTLIVAREKKKVKFTDKMSELGFKKKRNRKHYRKCTAQSLLTVQFLSSCTCTLSEKLTECIVPEGTAPRPVSL